MKAVLQRVTRASVEVDGQIVGQIGRGIVVFVGIAGEDTESDAVLLADKIVNLRLLPDAEGKFNVSALDAGAALLLVSQFTLLADTRKGRRPSFTEAAPAAQAEPLFERVVSAARASGLTVATGRFQRHMLVNIQNDGPVTIMLDSTEKF